MNGKREVEKTFQKFLGKKLQYLSNKNGFLGIDNKFNFKEKVKELGIDEKFLSRQLNVGFSGGEKKKNEI